MPTCIRCKLANCMCVDSYKPTLMVRLYADHSHALVNAFNANEAREHLDIDMYDFDTFNQLNPELQADLEHTYMGGHEVPDENTLDKAQSKFNDKGY